MDKSGLPLTVRHKRRYGVCSSSFGKIKLSQASYATSIGLSKNNQTDSAPKGFRKGSQTSTPIRKPLKRTKHTTTTTSLQTWPQDTRGGGVIKTHRRRINKVEKVITVRWRSRASACVVVVVVYIPFPLFLPFGKGTLVGVLRNPTSRSRRKKSPKIRFPECEDKTQKGWHI